jgi:hypothetical protein
MRAELAHVSDHDGVVAHVVLELDFRLDGGQNPVEDWGSVSKPGLHPTSANLSPPLVANTAQIFLWSAARTLIATLPIARIKGQLDDVDAGQKHTYGGCRHTDVTD